MAGIKSLGHQVMLLLLVAVLMVENCSAQPQSCSAQLNNLNVCAPFVLPGASNANPSAECCGALEAVQHDCLCNTLRIASTLPSMCHLPSFSCGAN